jgi:hypothetical protein
MGLDRRLKAAVVVVMVMGGMQTITQTSSSKPSAVCEAHGSHSALCTWTSQCILHMEVTVLSAEHPKILTSYGFI